ncbi:hypothetical protein DDV98_27515 [Streptomyces sp. IB2014 011-12]|nr:hypothetical protein DDV98_27515 [Streptomyces sp. IB2014 011-12]
MTATVTPSAVSRSAVFCAQWGSSRSMRTRTRVASATVCQASASSTATISAVSGPVTVAMTALAWVGWVSSRTWPPGTGDVTKRCSPCEGVYGGRGRVGGVRLIVFAGRAGRRFALP